MVGGLIRRGSAGRLGLIRRGSAGRLGLMLLAAMAAGAVPGVAAARGAATPTVQITTLPVTDASLNGISCPSAKLCFAVGDVQAIGPAGPQSTALIERFDGRHWSESLRLPDTVSSLSAISCVSTSFCLAVGYDGAFPAPTLAMAWNGQAWSRVASASPSSAGEGDDLLGVDCISRHECWAVGGSNIDVFNGPLDSLIERFDGVTLQQVTAPDAGSELSTIGCPTATSCYATAAVGSLERLTGSAWQLAPPPKSRSGNAETITCRTSAMCWILASTPTKNALVALDLVHGRFRPARTQPTGPAVNPQGSDCATATDCWLVGSSTTGFPSLSFRPLAEHWDGTRWVAASSRTDYHGDAELAAVSCPCTGLCVAVGHSLLDAHTSPLVSVIKSD